MTNRDKLFRELDALNGEQLFMALGRLDIVTRLNDYACADCMAQRGGECQAPDDDACLLPVADWMDQPCTRDSLLAGISFEPYR